MKDFKHELGITVKDSVTGIEGVVTGCVRYLTGCDQYLVQPVTKSKTKIAAAVCLDENRVSRVGKKKVKIKPADNGLNGPGEPPRPTRPGDFGLR